MLNVDTISHLRRAVVGKASLRTEILIATRCTSLSILDFQKQSVTTSPSRVNFPAYIKGFCFHRNMNLYLKKVALFCLVNCLNLTIIHKIQAL